MHSKPQTLFFPDTVYITYTNNMGTSLPQICHKIFGRLNIHGKISLASQMAVKNSGYGDCTGVTILLVNLLRHKVSSLYFAEVRGYWLGSKQITSCTSVCLKIISARGRLQPRNSLKTQPSEIVTKKVAVPILVNNNVWKFIFLLNKWEDRN